MSGIAGGFFAVAARVINARKEKVSVLTAGAHLSVCLGKKKKERRRVCG